MKLLSFILVLTVLFSFNCVAYASSSDDKDSGGGNDTLTGALLGGLLGGGVGTAIGSASGHAGTGALWGAGIGAVGGALLGSTRSANKAKADENMTAQQPAQNSADEGQGIPSDMKVKKRIIKQYDKEGNLVSQKEVAN